MLDAVKRYILLIRGINVGGNNKVGMPLLKASIEQAGFENVTTYINSGNVLFESTEAHLPTLVATFEKILLDKFDVKTYVAVIPVDEFQNAVSHAPEWWGSDPESKHNALFVIAPASAKDIAKVVGEAKPEYERIHLHSHVIFWSAPVKTFSRTRWSKIVGTAAYDKVTIRNHNTVYKLAELTSQQ